MPPPQSRAQLMVTRQCAGPVTKSNAAQHCLWPWKIMEIICLSIDTLRTMAKCTISSIEWVETSTGPKYALFFFGSIWKDSGFLMFECQAKVLSRQCNLSATQSSPKSCCKPYWTWSNLCRQQELQALLLYVVTCCYHVHPCSTSRMSSRPRIHREYLRVRNHARPHEDTVHNKLHCILIVLILAGDCYSTHGILWLRRSLQKDYSYVGTRQRLMNDTKKMNK